MTDICQYCGSELQTNGCINPACPGRLRGTPPSKDPKMRELENAYIEEAQAYGQWSRRETVEMFYGRYEIDRLRALQTRGKVISLPDRYRKASGTTENKD
jgi:hypothetical protein